MARGPHGLSLFMAVTVLLVMPAAPGWAKGMITYSFDDGLTSVYVDAFPILKKYHQKATTGVVYDRVNSGNDAYMDSAQVLELQRNGWEVASHGYTHKRPTEIPQYFYQEALSGWEEDDKLPGVYETKYPYELVAELRANGTPLQVLGSLKDVSKTPGSYYHDTIIGTLHLRPYGDAHPRELDIRSMSYQREMSDSRKGLEGLGFNVTTFVTPYNYWTPEMREISKYYYAQAANGGESANFKDTLDRYWLKRFFIHTMGPAEEVIRLLKKNVVDKDGWVILCFHGIEDETGWQPWSAENLEHLAAWVQEQEIKVATIAEGVEIMESGFLKSLFK
jgi:hypothetical protein